jgi:hypothetical protein
VLENAIESEGFISRCEASTLKHGRIESSSDS